MEILWPLLKSKRKIEISKGIEIQISYCFFGFYGNITAR